jgi:glyoxylase-like metal-dependent hydrolase (beta-lactamase superfamily II)
MHSGPRISSCLILAVLACACERDTASDPSSEADHPAVSASAASDLLRTESHLFREMAPGVYFATGSGAVTVESNALVVVNADHVVIVDSHVTPDAARALISSVGALTDRPVRYLVNSHHHYDHSHGNAAFPPGVVVIGHEATRERLLGDVFAEPVYHELAGVEAARSMLRATESRLAGATDAETKAALEIELAALRRHAEAVREVEIRPPDVTLQRRLTLHGGDREIQLLFLGRGHTGGDVVAYLPAEKIVFTGDLLQPTAPYMGDSYPDEWIATLAALEQLDFQWVLPGHGEPFSGSAEIERFKRFLRAFQAEVRALRESGRSAGEAAARMELRGWETYAAWMLALPGVMELQVSRLFALEDEG